MSSIDMAPALFQRWGVPFDYLGSNGDVYSSHNGYFKRRSSCSVEVIHDLTEYSTYYGHLEPSDIEDGTFIKVGERIGRISIHPETSNCLCNWTNKIFSCATGPFLLFELRRRGIPESLDGKIISGLRIKAGLFPHDMHCFDPDDCTKATFQGKLCSTYYTNLTTEVPTCPCVKAGNFLSSHVTSGCNIRKK